MNDEDVILRVKHGAQKMDEYLPGWAQRINLENLHMDECERCIIGQAVGDFFTGIKNLFGVGISGFDQWAADHGFDIQPETVTSRTTDEQDIAEYRALEEAWTAEVRARVDG